MTKDQIRDFIIWYFSVEPKTRQAKDERLFDRLIKTETDVTKDIVENDIIPQRSKDLNTKYNEEGYQPIDGRLVRICDHLSALMEADISIKHGITSDHLTKGRDGTLAHYKENEIISGINVHELFQSLVTE